MTTNRRRTQSAPQTVRDTLSSFFFNVPGLLTLLSVLDARRPEDGLGRLDSAPRVGRHEELRMIIRDELAMSLAVLLNDIKALFPPQDLTQRSSLESGWPRGTSSISTGTWSVAAPSRRREEICEFPLPSKWTSENERREMSSEDSPKVADDICFVNDFDWSRLPPWRQQTTTDLENTGLFGAIGKAELARSGVFG